MIPHLVHASLLWVFSFYRLFNIVLGGFNTYLVYLIGRNYRGEGAGSFSSIFIRAFPNPSDFWHYSCTRDFSSILRVIIPVASEKNPATSSVFPALASQSRIEFLLISMIIIVGMGLAERSKTLFDLSVSHRLLVIYVTALFCWFFYSRTLNPAYPLYWSLYNLFGGWNIGGDADIIKLMISWVSTKVSAWSTKLSGIITLFLTTSIIAFHTWFSEKRKSDGLHLLFRFAFRLLLYSCLI